MQSEQINDLVAALSKAQGQLDNAKKGIENSFFKSKYADLAECINAAKKVLAENGLAIIQTTEINESGGVVLVTMLSHSTGQWIKGYYPIAPTKGDPQAYGSAMTYARRYAYCAIIGLASEDDDGNAASTVNKTTSTEPPSKANTKEFKNTIDLINKSTNV